MVFGLHDRYDHDDVYTAVYDVESFVLVSVIAVMFCIMIQNEDILVYMQ